MVKAMIINVSAMLTFNTDRRPFLPLIISSFLISSLSFRFLAAHSPAN